MSDGAAESLFHKKEQRLAPAVTRMFDWFADYATSKIGRALKANLRGVVRNMTQDDCSIVLMRACECLVDDLAEAPVDVVKDFLGGTRHKTIIRKKKIALLAGAGKAPAEIAKELGISLRTVKRHLAQI